MKKKNEKKKPKNIGPEKLEVLYESPFFFPSLFYPQMHIPLLLSLGFA